MNTVKDINDLLFSYTNTFDTDISPGIENAKSRGQLRKAVKKAVVSIKQLEYRLQQMDFDKDLETPVSLIKLYFSTARKGFEYIAKGNAYKGAQYDRRAREIYAEYLRRFV
ncbi:hypothetical protein ACFVRA_05860 [Bacillus subtilis]